MEQVTVRRDIPVTGEYDVVVCGGGPAGWIAAVSAARGGCRVALVERLGFLGGTATAGLVVPISGFYFQGRRVVGGIAWEFVKKMEALGAAQIELPRGHVSVHPEYYKLIAHRMVRESGVELYTNSYLTGCLREGERITHVLIDSKNGPEAIAGRCFIDATGDGDLCHMAGIPMLESGEGLQPISLCFVLAGVDATTPLLRDCIHHDGKEGRRSVNTAIRDYLMGLAEKGEIPQFGGPWFNALLKGDSLAVNVTRAAADATDRAAFAAAEEQLREDMFRIVEALRVKYPEFSRCEIVSSAVNAGVRETRRIKGLYTMTAKDVADGTVFDCPVAHIAHPMDIHSAKGAGQRLLPVERDAFVPYETMVSDCVANLIAAGRCISAEKEPYASVRVQATLMSVGEAAGVAAALLCESGDTAARLRRDELGKRMRERGFVL